MERQFDHKKGADLDAVMHWEIGRPGGGADRWQLTVADGRARTSRKLDREPRATIKIDGERFLELVAGVVSGPELYMTGKVRIEGDVMFAAQLQGFFRMPARGSPALSAEGSCARVRRWTSRRSSAEHKARKTQIRGERGQRAQALPARAPLPRVASRSTLPEEISMVRPTITETARLSPHRRPDPAPPPVRLVRASSPPGR